MTKSLVWTLGLCAALAASAPRADPSFSGVGILAGYTGSWAVAVSANGSVVVGGTRSGPAWRLQNGDMVPLGTLTTSSGQERFVGTVLGLSDDGEVVIGTFDDLAYRWKNGEFTDLGSLAPWEEDRHTVPWAVSADGEVIVGESTSPFYPNTVEAFHWTAGTMTLLPNRRDATGYQRRSSARGLSGDARFIVGHIFGGAVLFADHRGILTQPRPFAGAPGFASASALRANAVSSDGQVVVGHGYVAARQVALRWRGLIPRPLMPDPLRLSEPYLESAVDVSGDGEIIVGTLGGSFEPGVWTENTGARPLVDVLSQEFGLDLTEWRLTTVEAISLDGSTMVGRGINPDGVDEGWIAVVGFDDVDGDGVRDILDNCMRLFNPDQANLDGNALGDLCNDFEDLDGDEIADLIDNCPEVANPGQGDLDRYGAGDACNDFEDQDGDDIADFLDNCPDVPNPSGVDGDGDGLGDACDPFPERTDHEIAQLEFDRDAAREERDAALEDLDMCLARRFFLDDDDDGEDDSTDACPGTSPGEATDEAGCSRSQFCASIPTSGFRGLLGCLSADWRNDEGRTLRPGDCSLEWSGGWFGCR